MCHIKNGPVAQLGERHTGSVEVVGSIPIGSTLIKRREPLRFQPSERSDVRPNQMSKLGSTTQFAPLMRIAPMKRGLSTSAPSYRLHKASGQARVTINWTLKRHKSCLAIQARKLPSVTMPRWTMTERLSLLKSTDRTGANCSQLNSTSNRSRLNQSPPRWRISEADFEAFVKKRSSRIRFLLPVRSVDP